MAQPLSFHDAPFYPPLQARNREPDLVSRFQKLHPRWYERVETNRNTADIAGKTSFVAGLVTLSSYFFLGGTPRFVLTAVSALGGVTVISGIASAFFFRRSCWNDPAYCIDQGRRAAEDIVTNRLNLSQIEEKYSMLREHNLLQDADLNHFFRERIKDLELSFKDTIAILRGSPNFRVALDEFNRDSLKQKFVLYLESGEASSVGAFEKECLGIYEKDFNFQFCFLALENLVGRLITYPQFLTGVCVENWVVFSQENLLLIKPFVLSHLIKRNIGWVQALGEKDVATVRISPLDFVFAGGLSRDLISLREKKLSYGQFRTKHSTSVFSLIDIMDLKRAYVSSYRNIHDYPGDAKLFDLRFKAFSDVVNQAIMKEKKAIQVFKEALETDSIELKVLEDKLAAEKAKIQTQFEEESAFIS